MYDIPNEFISLLATPINKVIKTSKRYIVKNISDDTLMHYKSMKVLSQELGLPYQTILHNFLQSDVFIMEGYQFQKVVSTDTEFIMGSTPKESIHTTKIVDNSYTPSGSTLKTTHIPIEHVISDHTSKNDVRPTSESASSLSWIPIICFSLVSILPFLYMWYFIKHGLSNYISDIIPSYPYNHNPTPSNIASRSYYYESTLTEKTDYINKLITNESKSTKFYNWVGDNYVPIIIGITGVVIVGAFLYSLYGSTGGGDGSFFSLDKYFKKPSPSNITTVTNLDNQKVEIIATDPATQTSSLTGVSNIVSNAISKVGETLNKGKEKTIESWNSWFSTDDLVDLRETAKTLLEEGSPDEKVLFLENLEKFKRSALTSNRYFVIDPNSKLSHALDNAKPPTTCISDVNKAIEQIIENADKVNQDVARLSMSSDSTIDGNRYFETLTGEAKEKAMTELLVKVEEIRGKYVGLASSNLSSDSVSHMFKDLPSPPDRDRSYLRSGWGIERPEVYSDFTPRSPRRVTTFTNPVEEKYIIDIKNTEQSLFPTPLIQELIKRLLSSNWFIQLDDLLIYIFTSFS